MSAAGKTSQDTIIEMLERIAPKHLVLRLLIALPALPIRRDPQ